MRIARTSSRPPLPAAVVTLLWCVIAVAGCGLGPGKTSEGTATLTVTRDFGSERLVEASSEDPSESETVARFLDREAEIKTSYSGNFINAIEGVENTATGGSQQDWFFYVNGYWSPVGAAEAKVRPGDEIWWDYREWSGAYRVPAVVGSFPEPFAHGYGGEQPPTVVDCRAEEGGCEKVEERLADAGARIADPRSGEDALRVLVGETSQLLDDPALRLLGRGPEASGVYAQPVQCGEDVRLSLLTELADPAVELEEFSLVAATQRADRQPIWIVTGSTQTALDLAIESLDEDALADRYALVLDAGEPIDLPADSTMPPEECG